jgi:tRNA U34 2-thiouridine synthase MnmA/TrmU
MAQRPKVRRKQKKPKDTDKRQSERFKQTARELGADMSMADFEKTFQRIAKKKTT